MTVVLASPRFLFRLEEPDTDSVGPFPLVDEYALASRLSYFMWSTMPDHELWIGFLRDPDGNLVGLLEEKRP